MRKLLAMVLGLVMCFSFVACSSKEEDPVNSVVPPEEKTTGSVSVEILSTKVSKDTSNNDAVIVEYKFKNDTQKDLAFKFSTKVTVKQGETALKLAVVAQNDIFDSGTATKPIKPGADITAQVAYVPVDMTTPLDITVSLTQGESKTDVSKQLTIAK